MIQSPKTQVSSSKLKKKRFLYVEKQSKSMLLADEDTYFLKNVPQQLLQICIEDALYQMYIR